MTKYLIIATLVFLLGCGERTSRFEGGYALEKVNSESALVDSRGYVVIEPVVVGVKESDDFIFGERVISEYPVHGDENEEIGFFLINKENGKFLTGLRADELARLLRDPDRIIWEDSQLPKHRSGNSIYP